MANKKVVSVLSTAAIGTLIATAVGSTVFAAVDGLVVKNAAGAYFNYDLDALKASVVNDALGQAGAELYKDFDVARTAGSIVSYHDDKAGFVDAAAVQKAALDAALAGTEFKLDTFTESSKETVLPAAVYQAEVKDGKVVAGAEVKPTTAATQAVTVNAIGAKTLKVTFAKAVDTTKATLSVKKGSITINTSSVTWNDAKTEATVVLAGKLTAGDYVATVSGITDAALTGTVTVTDEKVSKIEILSTDAILVNVGVLPHAAGYGDLQVGYKVYNQYGEDITKTTSLTTSAAAVSTNQQTGIVTIAGEFNTTTNKLSTFTLIDSATATYASATVTAVSEAKVSDIVVKGIYNKDGKALTETTNLNSDLFYVELELKDQYGNVVTDGTKMNQVFVTQSNSTIISANAAPAVVTVNGVKRVFVALSGNALTGKPTVGSNIVTAIAYASGKSASTTVTVAESARAYSVDVSAPDVTVAGATTYVPINVTDKDGNAITDLSILTSLTRGVKVTVDGVDKTSELTIKDGQIYLAHVFNPAGYSTVMIVSNANQKVDTATLTVKAAAKGVIVTGLKSTTSTTVLKTLTKTLTVDDLVVEDQYGRVMTSSQINTWLAADAGNNKIVFADDAASGILSITSANDYIDSTHPSVTLTAGLAKGTESVSATIWQGTGVVATPTAVVSSSVYTAGLRVTDGTEYASYTVNSVGSVYDEVGAGKADTGTYDKTVKVYGVLADGSKVQLTNGVDYSVSSTNAAINADVSGDGILDISAAQAYASATDVTKVVPITVTINATGEKISQDVTISKVAPKIAKIDIVAHGDAANFLLYKSVDTLTNFTYNSAAAPFTFADLDAANAADIIITDQYGVRKQLTSATTNVFDDGDAVAVPAIAPTAITNLSLTFTKVSGDTLTFTANGTSAAAVTVAPLSSVFKVTVSADGVESTPVTVTVTQ